MVRITRSTNEVLDGLAHETIMQIEDLAAEIRELTATSAFAIQPPSAAHCYLMEQAGWTWDFDKGRYV